MKKAKQKKKVLVALSGGIDSAVSAYLLIKKGCQVEAAFMKNWSSTTGLKLQECPWLKDRQDALRVAAFLKIKIHTLDFEKEYQKTVMQYFFDEYKKGRTPNPDVMCNKEIKFKLLYNWAMKNGFNFLATGHYTQIKKVAFLHGRAKMQPSSVPIYRLLRSKDEFKDQTYFIYNVKQEQLPHLLFPIGGMKKKDVRSLARKIGLPNADRKESMGLCFVGKIRLKEFLEQKLKPKKGPIINQDGEKIGEHNGLYNFTLGQRQGVNIGGSGPYFVYAKDLKTNKLYVTNFADDDRLKTKEVQIHSVNWINNTVLSKQYTVLNGRYRHQGELVPLTIKKIKNDLYQVIFRRPQKAVASGQSLVLYKGKECVGGGVIV
ncbi:MAG: tRNA 2-thiouridine(34) synthase MnmA [Candidatus Doudnabacteria bacterium CG10_big_fil_rev_8_21_14_0_10_42_18]|uniref:tRNA-specific 2-thiouridylase MnmA n=1 Tax=Candidatus Doudnabacteria bacterium CG10_big_fil_rev_8_21_14_0_10_42_18 TaxID=1974552 RepID=A0A2H0VAG2_9BACT|nr:MAG: tRNA 2-thiouridine(34) synthase MnmA [Candidatus Doudnabacteria bacterium CG10_big_fil_rev_8_21_14_0_10_42_18]